MAWKGTILYRQSFSQVFLFWSLFLSHRSFPLLLHPLAGFPFLLLLSHSPSFLPFAPSPYYFYNAPSCRVFFSSPLLFQSLFPLLCSFPLLFATHSLAVFPFRLRGNTYPTSAPWSLARLRAHYYSLHRRNPRKIPVWEEKYAEVFQLPLLVCSSIMQPQVALWIQMFLS